MLRDDVTPSWRHDVVTSNDELSNDEAAVRSDQSMAILICDLALNSDGNGVLVYFSIWQLYRITVTWQFEPLVIYGQSVAYAGTSFIQFLIETFSLKKLHLKCRPFLSPYLLIALPIKHVLSIMHQSNVSKILFHLVKSKSTQAHSLNKSLLAELDFCVRSENKIKASAAKS